MQQGVTVWLTGLSGSGKSTICEQLAEIFKEQGVFYEVLDGDILRKSLNADLGFSKKDRFTNIKRTAFVASLLSRNGIVVLASFITPYESMRNYCRKHIESYVEVYVKCSLEECMRRDVKGLYRKAMAHEIREFTGVSDPYEKPEQPNLVVGTEEEEPEESAQRIYSYLKEQGILPK